MMPVVAVALWAPFAWALAPADGADPNELLKAAFARLLTRKRERRRREAEAASI